MSLENATKISELVATNPPGTDPVSQGDDHIRMIKNVLQLDAVAKTGPQTMEGPLTVTDTSGQLAGFRNILINGKLTINQRGVTIAAAPNGSYGPDRWKKVDASNMTQIVEEGNFIPSTVYTLSGTNVVTAQITSPASGNWTIPNVPITATNVQLEEGSIATPFEQRPVGLELSLCQRYFNKVKLNAYNYSPGPGPTTTGNIYHPVTMRVTPLLSNFVAGTRTNFNSSSVAGEHQGGFVYAITSLAAGMCGEIDGSCEASAEL